MVRTFFVDPDLLYWRMDFAVADGFAAGQSKERAAVAAVAVSPPSGSLTKESISRTNYR
jgi:hypothetical protein